MFAIASVCLKNAIIVVCFKKRSVMRKGLVASVLFLFVVCLMPNNGIAQIYAPDKDWGGLTQYFPEEDQDSVFVFFDDNEPGLRAQFSDSSASAYQWYKYDSEINPTIDRFQPLAGQTDSTLMSVSPGGYLVEVVRLSDDSTQVYVAWVMVDDVQLIALSLNSNSCESLGLYLSSSPNFYDVNSFFTYFDLSNYYNPDEDENATNPHQERNLLPLGGYFGSFVFESLNPAVEVPVNVGLPFIDIEFENEQNGKTYGPLADAAYRLTVTNPFGKDDMVVETDEIQAISTKVGLDIYFNTSNDNLPNWVKQDDEFPSEEALLEMKLESTAENADSLFWNIINDDILVKRGGDSIAWSDKSLFSERIESYPPKKYFVPGIFGVEHVSKKVTGNQVCMDTILRPVEVDTSFIDPTANPNVFSPNDDPVNQFFVLKDTETSVTSIKSFKISIVSRWGDKVYEYSGNPKEWEGWNGQVNGDGKPASEGVYFYVIEAVGWDGRKYKGGVYKGFLHLFR